MRFARRRRPGPWRHPAEETVGYPNLVVHDGRQSGSITVGQSRLPLWAIISTAITRDWDEVEAGWSPTENYGFTQDDLVQLVYSLFQLRGDFARLILALANGQRVDEQMSDAHYAENGVELDPGVVDITHVSPPPRWWDTPELAAPVAVLLERCLTIVRPVST